MKMGFILNPYDKCIANKEINGNTCTMAWYVDDNKISHVDNDTITAIVDEIEGKFGKLARTVGSKHTFLGMDIEFLPDKTVAIGTPQHIDEAIEDFGEQLNTDVTNPAKAKLFHIYTQATLLDKEKAELFHSVTAKLLWVSKRSRPDIETAISFLSTRVRSPTTEDWGKLKRVLSFLQKTKEDRRIFGTNGFSELSTYVDAAYAVHPNMRSHTGGCMSFGRGIVHAKSSKQKLNTKSSTEAEVVGVSDYAPYKIWMINFLKEQGYSLKKRILYQDNQSAIKMEKNGRNSCTGNSRHIDIRYFFTKDRVDKDEFSIEYCPTNEMVADFFTKPLQGAQFNNLRQVIMGWTPLNTSQHQSTGLSPSTSKERVGKHMSVENDENSKVRQSDHVRYILPNTNHK